MLRIKKKVKLPQSAIAEDDIESPDIECPPRRRQTIPIPTPNEEDRLSSGTDEESESDEGSGAGSDQGEDTDTDGDDSETMEAEPTRTEIRKELSNLSFEELLALKEKLGTKEYNEAMFGYQRSSDSAGSSSEKRKRQIKRDNKNRPREISSKIRVPAVREIVPISKKKNISRDPRFEQDCGKLNEEVWNTNYSFLRDMAKEEQKNLKKRFSKDKSLDETKKTKIKTFLQRVSNKERAAAKKAEEEVKRRAAKKDRQEQIAQGKKPYYMKKSTKKFVELAEKYDELKAKGKIESYLKKKRAKNASRDRKLLNL